MENMTIVRKNEILQIPVSMIKPNPYQVRRFFDKSMVKNLAESIKKFGVLQPICVRQLGKYSYEVVFGERRLKACKSIDMFYIPCIVVDIGDKDCAAISIIENVHRKNIDFFEMAEAVFNIIKYYECMPYEAAEILGEKESFVLQKLELLKIKYECREIIKKNNFSEEFALVLAKIEDKFLFKAIVEAVLKYNLNLVKTKALVEYIIQRTYLKIKTDEKDIEFIVSKIDKINTEKNTKFYVKNIKFFTNSVYEIIDAMNKSGINSEYKFDENDDFFEVNIKINK